MRDLRVYVRRPVKVLPGGQAVFYSRRADGPFYRWRYEDTPGGWHYSRVRLSKLTLRVLSITNWETIPSTLQARLGEHYLE